MPSTLSPKSGQNTHTTIVTLRERAAEMLRVADHLEATAKLNLKGIPGTKTATRIRARTKTKAGGMKKGPTVVAKAA